MFNSNGEHIGKKVYDLRYGYGILIDDFDFWWNEPHQVAVKFSSGKICYYTLDGKPKYIPNQMLFWDKPQIKAPECPYKSDIKRKNDNGTITPENFETYIKKIEEKNKIKIERNKF